MHILFLTWKDIRHPRAGGAERVILEYAKRLASDGHTVSWLGSRFRGAPDFEEIEGIHIYRKYHIYTIYFFAWIWYKKFTRKNPVDIIIDEAGGVPLLSPLYERKTPIYFFIHHIGEKEFSAEFHGPIGWLAKQVIFAIFRLYRSHPTITVSDSTAQELRKQFHFTDIHVLENTTDIRPISAIDWKKKKKEILFLGRLTRMKRVDHAIRAFAVFAKKSPEYSLKIIGNPQDPEYFVELQALTQELGIQEKVHFLGYVDSFDSHLLSAEILLVPSEKEGYGLVVLEANCFGVPALAYDVPGLRDSVRDGENGILIPDGDSTAMGEKMIELLADPEKFHTLSESSLTFIKNFGGWDERYREFKKIILLHNLQQKI